MSDKTKIEWTEATWNPVTGCKKVSAGCKHCYAERDWARLAHLPSYQGRAFTDVVCHPERLDQPLRWKRPRRIFVNSMSDLFHPDVPIEFIRQVFDVMEVCPQHTFQILTKRAERMQFLLWSEWDWKPAANIWLGVSVEDQATADERIPLLLQTPAAVRWISAEPLLGAVDLSQFLIHSLDEAEAVGNYGLDWVVAGGESGSLARPMYPDWVRNLRNQCADANVPFLFKQWGEWAPSTALPQDIRLRYEQWAWTNEQGGEPHVGFGPFKDEFAHHELMGKVGKARAGRLLDGVLHDGYPQEGGM